MKKLLRPAFAQRAWLCYKYGFTLCHRQERYISFILTINMYTYLKKKIATTLNHNTINGSKILSPSLQYSIGTDSLV